MAVPDEVSFQLPRHHSSVPRARALLHAMLGDHGTDHEVLATAELVLSELLTNALRVDAPPGSAVGVRLLHRAGDGLLRLEVTDFGPGRPVVRTPSDDAIGGRGLLLVDAVTHRWGVRDHTDRIGKTVWAELKAPPTAAANPAERKISAITVQRGQQVKVRDQWRTIHTIRSARGVAGDFVLILGLDNGLSVHVNAVEPLTVRGGGGPPVRRNDDNQPQ